MKRSITQNSILKKTIQGLLVAIFWLLVWELVYLYVEKEILIVSPFRAARRLFELSGEALFWRSVLSSCLRVLQGFLLALVTGSALAILTAKSKVVYILAAPIMGIIKTTPVASFIILALLWISTGRLPVFISFLMVAPLVWTNLHTGIKSADPKLLEMAKVFHLSLWRRVRYIYVPAILPYFVAACSTGIGFAWKSAVAAEIISKPDDAIGTRIHESRIYLETADLFAWTVAVVLLSLLLEKLTLFLLRRGAERYMGGRQDKTGHGASQ